MAVQGAPGPDELVPGRSAVEAVGIAALEAPDEVPALRVMVEDFQGIGRLGVVVEVVASAGGGDRLGGDGLHAPVDRVEQVADEIGQQPAAVIPVAGRVE